MMNDKFAIVNWGRSNVGKTASIIEVWNLLKSEYSDDLENTDEILHFGNPHDILVKTEFRGVKLGICSYGDAGQYYRTTEILKTLLGWDSQIMVLASRTSGRTVDEIRKLEPLGWEIRWEQNERSKDSNEYDRYNKGYARKVVDMIIERISTGN